MRLRTLLVTATIAGMLTACAPGSVLGGRERIEKEVARNGTYWQRKDATSALWLQGPKAQEVLNRDISRCVVETRELEKLGQIKAAFPAEKSDTIHTADGARQKLMEWDTPERDAALLVEPTEFQDFETCMISKGWERIMYVPYDTAERGGKAYVENHIVLKERTKTEHRGQDNEQKSPYDHMNN